MYIENTFNTLLQVALISRPIFAAVHGLTFGGGCELAIMCELIVAHQDTKIGQPEIKLGSLPGVTQRLPRLTSKTKVKEMILTGEHFSADEAKEIRLVSRVSQGDVVQSALEIARLMKRYPLQALIMNEAALNDAYETSLQGGDITEIAFFNSSASRKDKEEGIAAFLSRRPAKVTNE
jgi:enoyl-CoA hydratase/carnithine racemase